MLQEGDAVRVVLGERPMAGQAGTLVRLVDEPLGCIVVFLPAYRTLAYDAHELEHLRDKVE